MTEVLDDIKELVTFSFTQSKERNILHIQDNKIISSTPHKIVTAYTDTIMISHNIIFIVIERQFRDLETAKLLYEFDAENILDTKLYKNKFYCLYRKDTYQIELIIYEDGRFNVFNMPDNITSMLLYKDNIFYIKSLREL